MRLLLGTLFSALLALAASPAAAQEAASTLSIAPGETVTVRIADSGGFVVLSRDSSAGAASGRPQADTARFTFDEAGGSMRLSVRHGYDRPLLYRTRMFVRGRSQATSLCAVMPGAAGSESWPQAAERIELSAPRLMDVPAGAVLCR